jgi:spermidine/putrescine transport system permease protein
MALLVVPACLLVLGLLIGPMILMFRISLNQFDPTRLMVEAFSFDNYARAATDPYYQQIILVTLGMALLCTVLTLVIAYPAAYFVARFAGHRKGLFLILLIAPFWISYMMRMLAWIDLLQTDGYVNKALSFLHLISQPVDWLGGLHVTVVLGLVYGYIPYLILVLYAGLDRIDPALIEAGRDLGLGRVRTFIRVTLPLSRQAILTGMLITVLPMLGDYFTNQLLSGTTGTTMFGNVIDDQLTSSGGVLEGQGAVFSLLFLVVLTAPMIYYVVATNRSSRRAT